MDYPYIWAWGWMMGSHRSYILDQLVRAKQTNAPQDALYELHDRAQATGEWARFNERDHPLPAATLSSLEQAAANHGVTLPHQEAPANQQ